MASIFGRGALCDGDRKGIDGDIGAAGTISRDRRGALSAAVTWMDSGARGPSVGARTAASPAGARTAVARRGPSNSSWAAPSASATARASE